MLMIIWNMGQNRPCILIMYKKKYYTTRYAYYGFHSISYPHYIHSYTSIVEGYIHGMNKRDFTIEIKSPL